MKRRNQPITEQNLPTYLRVIWNDLAGDCFPEGATVEAEHVREIAADNIWQMLGIDAFNLFMELPRERQDAILAEAFPDRTRYHV